MSSRIAQGLPTNPRSIVGGRSTPSRQFEAPRPQSRTSAIPSNPRPRTPSSHRSERRPAAETRESAPRVPQRSIPQDHRSERRPAAETRERAPRVSQRSIPQEVRRRSDESVSTSSSSNASYWSRGHVSRSSSRTTFQSDRDTDNEDRLRETPAKESQAVNNYIDTGFVWGRVTEAANVITQEVSKVWAAGLSSNGAENDAPEEESHLTRVMRAYHLSKARTPSELPEWLFNERERGQGGLLRFDKPNSHGDGSQTKSVPAQQAQRHNRPTYGDNTARLGSQLRISRDTEDTKPLVPPAKLSGSDRLKQMRDLRRNAPSSTF